MILPTIEGTQVDLHPYQRRHRPDIVKFMQDRIISRYMPQIPYPYSDDDARIWINIAQRHARRNEGYHFAIEHCERKHLIGGIGLKNLNFQDLNAEVGCWLARPFRRHGHTRESMTLILDFAFSVLRMHRVYAIVLSSNIASVGLLEKCGFVREANWREGCRVGRTWCDVYAYGIIDREFRGR